MSLMIPTTIKFLAAATGTTIDYRPSERGKFNYMLLKTPNFTNDITVNISILDEEGDVVWEMSEAYNYGQSVAAQGRNLTVRYQFDDDIPIHRGWIVRATLSGVAGGAGGTIKCMIAIEANK